MIEQNTKNYVLYNGERINWNTKKWESCDSIPNDGEEAFRKTLDSELEKQN